MGMNSGINLMPLTNPNPMMGGGYNNQPMMGGVNMGTNNYH